MPAGRVAAVWTTRGIAASRCPSAHTRTPSPNHSPVCSRADRQRPPLPRRGPPTTPSPWLFTRDPHLAVRSHPPASANTSRNSGSETSRPMRHPASTRRPGPRSRPAELLHLTPGTATRWTRDAAGDWSRYAAELARRRDHQPAGTRLRREARRSRSRLSSRQRSSPSFGSSNSLSS